jgi:hypothetical protein
VNCSISLKENSTYDEVPHISRRESEMAKTRELTSFTKDVQERVEIEMDHRRRVQCQQLREHQTADLRYPLPSAKASLTSLFQWPVLRRLVTGQPSLRRETRRRSRYADAHLFNLMRREDK